MTSRCPRCEEAGLLPGSVCPHRADRGDTTARRAAGAAEPAEPVESVDGGLGDLMGNAGPAPAGRPSRGVGEVEIQDPFAAGGPGVAPRWPGRGRPPGAGEAVGGGDSGGGKVPSGTPGPVPVADLVDGIVAVEVSVEGHAVSTRITDRTCVIGRCYGNPVNDYLRETYPNVSREHLRVSFVGGTVTVEDVSRNGTFYGNGTRLPERKPVVLTAVGLRLARNCPITIRPVYAPPAARPI